MFLRKLSVLNFKNVGQAELAFAPGINCFAGGNGAGKTNLIEAIYYMSMCKSSLTMTDAQNVRHGSDFFVLDAEYAQYGDPEKKEHVVCSFKKGAGKTLKRNGKEYDKLSDHVGLIPVVIISPTDTALVNDAAEERRRYLNSFLSQLDKPYLAAIIRYNHLLGERNRLLKQPFGRSTEEIMDILDMQLAETGEIVRRKRAEAVERLIPYVAEYYRILSDDHEQIELEYRSELNDTPFAQLLASSRERDRMNQFTTSGIHRDDLKMKIGGYPLRKYGSQGQQKSFLIALKLAQYSVVAEHAGKKPILLLDDLFDKLDMRRVERLIGLVAANGFGQTFITDCNKVRLERILETVGHNYTLFNVAEGIVEQI